MTNEEAFFVVIRVDKPAGDSVWTVADDFAGLRFEYVHAFDANSHFFLLEVFNFDVWFAEDNEQICRSRGF